MTTTYQVQGPDGQTHQFSGPDGASQDQVMAAAAAQFGGKAAPAPAPAAAAPPAQTQTPQTAAFAQGQKDAAAESPVGAGISQAAQQATMGLNNYVNAGARYVAQRVAGVDKPDDFSTDVAYSRGRSQGEANSHPTASTIGGIAGAVAGPGKVASGIDGLVKGALAAGGMATTQALAQGQGVPQAAEAGALNAVAAPITKVAGDFAYSRLAPDAQRAFMALSKTLKISPTDLQAVYNVRKNTTGALPSMAELATDAQQGRLRSLAAANPTVAEAARIAQQSGNAPLHEQIATANAAGATRPQTTTGLTSARDNFMDDTMQNIGQTPVHDTNGTLLSPHVEMALMGDTKTNAKLSALAGNGGFATPGDAVMDRVLNNSQTLSDVDFIRQRLRDQQSSYMSPSIGSDHPKNIDIAKQFGDAANQVEALGKRAHPDYGPALDQYRTISDYTDAFEHGLSGKGFAEGATDDRLAGKMQSASDKLTTNSAGTLATKAGSKLSRAEQATVGGYNHGNALYQGQQVYKTIAPPSIPQEGSDAAKLAHTIAAVKLGSPTGLMKAWQGIVGDRLPANAQAIVAKQLFSKDPTVFQQGINNLRRAGLADDAIHGITQGIGGTTASVAAQASSPGPQQ